MDLYKHVVRYVCVYVSECSHSNVYENAHAHVKAIAVQVVSCHMKAYIQPHIRMHTYMNAPMQKYSPTYSAHIHTHTLAHIHTYRHTHTYIHTYTRIDTHTDPHPHVCACVLPPVSVCACGGV